MSLSSVIVNISEKAATVVNLITAMLPKPYVDVRDYSSFAAAVGAIGSTKKALLVPNEQGVSANITVPTNIGLKIPQGGSLAIATGVTVTINGDVDAGLYQIFSWVGTGTVVFGPGSVKEVHIQWWGAKPDTDDTAAIQAAYDSVGDNGGIVRVAPGTWLITDTLHVNKDGIITRGSSQYKSVIKCATTGVDMFDFGPSGEIRVFLGFEDIMLKSESNAGHIFAPSGGTAQAHFTNVSCRQDNPDKSIWDAINKLYIDNVWSNCELQHTPYVPTVSGFKLVSSGGDLNSNTWKRLRCTYSGEYFFHVESTHPSAYAVNNIFDDINFEVCNGGCVKLLSALNPTIKNCMGYDFTTTTRDLFVVGASPTGGLASRGPVFRQVGRATGVLGGGLVDIQLAPIAGVNHITLDSLIAPIAVGFKVNLGGSTQWVMMSGTNYGVTFTNLGAATLSQSPNGGWLFGADVDIYREAANVLALAAGDSFHLVDGNIKIHLQTYADNTAAKNGGLVAGQLYCLNSNPCYVCVVY